MRILLATAVAIAPLMAAVGAEAQVVIENERTTPIVTSTANNGAAADVQIKTGGNIKVASGAAVTVDSDNDLDIDSGGSITMTDATDGATGVLIQGGNSSAITIGAAPSTLRIRSRTTTTKIPMRTATWTVHSPTERIDMAFG